MLPLEQRIFEIQNDIEFNALALEVYHYQANNIDVYQKFIQYLNLPTPKHYSEIPFLPISFFKTHEIIAREASAQATFKSSGTTGMERSCHYVKDLSIYEDSFTKAYSEAIGNPKDQIIVALLPNYVEQGDSSLVYMVNKLIKLSESPLSGFVLDEPEKIEFIYNEALNSNKQMILFGVSYALLDLAELGVNLSKAKIIETGGMKGRRKELSKEELHQEIINGLKVPFVSSEYGMTELLSQGYSDKNGLFTTPNWMKVLIRDIDDPLSLARDNKTGGINVIDLANINSCSFIATQDLGRIENSNFRIMGRFDNSDIRGCNLLIQ